MTGVGVWLGVAILGGLGALARFGLDGRLGDLIGREFPWGTFTVNISGAFALGMLTAFPLGHIGLLLLGTATLGSYTTFSTWMLESHRLGENGESLALAVNLLLTMLAGIMAATLGWEIGKAL